MLRCRAAAAAAAAAAWWGGVRVASRARAMSTKFVPPAVALHGVGKMVGADRWLFSNVSLTIPQGSRVAIIGPNGAGKSSLMKIVAGADRDFTGSIDVADGVRVGFLAQEPVQDPEMTVRATVESGAADRLELLQRYDQIATDMGLPDADLDKLLADQEAVQRRIEETDSWNAPREIQMAMEALRVPPVDAYVGRLSGGERRRVDMARVLVQRPELLLLDEPTNHLDAFSIKWLEEYLNSYQGTVMCVTHDRYFLDRVVNTILEIDRGNVYKFHANYTGWLEMKEARMEVEKKQEDAASRMIKQELEWMRQPAKARQKKSKARMAAYDELVSTQRVPEGAILIPTGPRLGKDVLKVENLSKEFNGRQLIDRLTMEIEAGSVVGVVGPNGCGKSTLFRLLTGETQPDHGKITMGATVRVGLVAQMRDDLHLDQPLYREIVGDRESVRVGEVDLPARTYVAQFGFKGPDQQKHVRMLSGGERNRVHLAKALAPGYNVLLLDEPTNDLDVATLRALETAIPAFPGVVMVVSHDRFFLDRICTHVLAFGENGRVELIEGGFAAYEHHLRERRRSHSHAR